MRWGVEMVVNLSLFKRSQEVKLVWGSICRVVGSVCRVDGTGLECASVLNK